MQFNRKALLIGGTLLFGLSSVALADGDTATDLSAQIEALKAQVAAQQAQGAAQQSQIAAQQAQIAALKDKGDEKWLNEERTEEIKGLIRDALADADTRASLAEDGATSGNDGQFFIKTADDSFRLNIGGQLQVRYIADIRASNNLTGNAGSDDGHELGFSLRRIKIGFTGWIGDPKIQYKVVLAGDRDLETMYAEEAWGARTFGDSGVTIWGGRFQDWFGREQASSSKYMQNVEKGVADLIFGATDGWVEGIGVEWKAIPEYLWFHLTYNDGFNSGVDAPAGAGVLGGAGAGHDYYNGDADYAFSFRIDVKACGDWSKANAPTPAPRQLTDAESWSTEQGPQVFFGLGGHYEEAKTGNEQGGGYFTLSADTPAKTSATATSYYYNEFYEWTADTLVKYKGLSFLGAFYGLTFPDTYTNASGTASHHFGDINYYGASAQASYMVIPDKLEPFVRYEWIEPDTKMGTNQLNAVTAGFNWFFKQHAAKLTLDAVMLLNNLNTVTDLNTSMTGAGLLPDDYHRKGQVVFRAQFQLLF